ncbi:MAG TPA: hypothetical protein DD671_07710 [Balneolaceae bacterium]|nr:hypothetical protein [Balneola sp.]HBQ59503.1 hypothetical protein [Balneolaceae bacterium]|tara:strand:- start:20874 stop:21113 length:240 start_codon:yes stop_codon:yes gene_type:complete
MLQSFYENLGFFGALFTALLLFFLFIFWMAGIAGITLPYDGGRKKGNNWQIIVAVLFPPYPILWLLLDIFMQHRHMSEE